MSEQVVYEKFYKDLENLSKAEIIELMKQEHTLDAQINDAQLALNELIYSKVHFLDILDYLGKSQPGETNKEKKIRNVLYQFVSSVMDNDLFFMHNANYIKNPFNYEKLQ